MTQKCECGCGKTYEDEEMLSPEEVWRWNAKQVFRTMEPWPYPTLERFQKACRAIPNFKEPHVVSEWSAVYWHCIGAMYN